MKATFRQLKQFVNRLTEKQLDCDLTVELASDTGNECYEANFGVCSDEHDSLDVNHPVIMVNYMSMDRMTDDEAEQYINRIFADNG